MSAKTKVMAGMIIGSSLGGYLPSLWGDSLFSYSGLILSTIGGLLGIYIGYKLSQ
ncbi:hypothetical protein HZA76_02250 [Candidatus Roizmanbacteria bacterium]|nr:hypothetical protein [Candidatus Roizmanbacteria bacterium]